MSNPSSCINRASGVLMTLLGSDGVIMGSGTNEYLLPAEPSTIWLLLRASDINVGSSDWVQVGEIKGTLPTSQGSFNYTNESRNCILSSKSYCQIINAKAEFYTPLLTRMES